MSFTLFHQLSGYDRPMPTKKHSNSNCKKITIWICFQNWNGHILQAHEWKYFPKRKFHENVFQYFHWCCNSNNAYVLIKPGHVSNVMCYWERGIVHINGKFNRLEKDFYLASVWNTRHCQYGRCYFKHRTSCTVIFIVNQKFAISSFNKTSSLEVNLKNVKANVFQTALKERKKKNNNNKLTFG